MFFEIWTNFLIFLHVLTVIFGFCMKKATQMVYISKSMSLLSDQASKLKSILVRNEEKEEIKDNDTKPQHSEEKVFAVPPPEVIAPLIDNQSAVEKQLQQQVNFYQDALEKLNKRSNEIGAENARLYERMRKTTCTEDCSDNNEGEEDSRKSDSDNEEDIVPPKKERLLRTKHECHQSKLALRDLSTSHKDNSLKVTGDLNIDLLKMKELYDMKTSHLQSLLNSAMSQIDAQQQDITKLRSEARFYSMPVRDDEGFCENDLAKTIISRPTLKLVDQLKKEKIEVEESLQSQQKLLSEGRKREAEAYNQVKKSCELVEQLQIEKQQLTMEKKQLKESVQSYQEKYQQSLKDIQLTSEKSVGTLKKDMQNTIDRLNIQLEEQASTVASLTLQLEKAARDKTVLKQECHQLRNALATSKQHAQNILEGSQKEILEALKGRTLTEQENQDIRSMTTLQLRQKQKVNEQLSLEVENIKRRLQVSDTTAKDLQEQMMFTTKELNSNKQQLQKEMFEKENYIRVMEDEKRRWKLECEQKEQHMAGLLRESESRYYETKEETSSVIESQTQLINKYKFECKSISQQLMEEKKNHKEDVVRLTKSIEVAKETCKKDTDEQNEKEQLIEDLRKQVECLEEVSSEQTEKMVSLMNKQNALLQERNLLTKEIQLLRCQPTTID